MSRRVSGDSMMTMNVSRSLGKLLSAVGDYHRMLKL